MLFNTALDADNTPSLKTNTLKKVMEDHDLCDMFGIRNPDMQRYTWFKINKEIKDQNGRILILDVDIQEEPYVLINYYANNDQAGQVKTLTELCDLLEKIEFKENTKVIWGEILICFSIQPWMQTILHL